MTAPCIPAPRMPIFAGAEASGWIERTVERASEPAVSEAAVREILDDVRTGGDAAVRRCAAAYDGGAPSALRVPPARCREALAALSPERRRALERARDNIATRHDAQIRKEAPVEVEPGVAVWREFRPIRRVGLYVPGGGAAYPSSLLMTAVLARIAGCSEVVACSPAGISGEPDESVLAAAALVGVDELYAIGGAHAIAAMAYGTETIGAVDKVFGPGGAWVNAAKLAVFGTVAIDLPAGPSEIAVWADAGGSPDRIAAELVAQAEHGGDAVCVAVLSDEGAGSSALRELARSIGDHVSERAARLEGGRRAAAASALAAGAVLVAPDDARAAEWVDTIAPEHLSIQAADPEARLARVGNAGAVFLGPTSPVAAGDYCTGANHVLPTGGRARGAGGLDLDAFGRWISVQRLSAEGLARLAPTISTLAEWEGLYGHAAAARDACLALTWESAAEPIAETTAEPVGRAGGGM